MKGYRSLIEIQHTRVRVMWDSAEHWLRNLEECRSGKWDGLSVGALPVSDEECPACREYLHGSERYCDGCPITHDSGAILCSNTPWDDVNYAVAHYSVLHSDLQIGYLVELEYGYLVGVALKEGERLAELMKERSDHEEKEA